MVDIYLSIEGRHVLALSIPFSDIQRLSLHPVKWLRFVTFAICGVRGNLSATPNGPSVDYDSIALDDPLAEAYYYTPDGDYHIIDCNGMNDRFSSSENTFCTSSFRRGVKTRDGPVCVFTRSTSKICDAAHLLPKARAMGYLSVYIDFVLQDRHNSYDPALEPISPGINAVENGIFLTKDLHALFGIGYCAFLKTPNFALDTADIPRVETDPMPPSRITLHHFKPDTSLFPIPQYGACIAGTGIPPPSTLILDFMYGIAAYLCWGSGQDIEGVMRHRFTESYELKPIPPAPVHDDDDDDDDDDDEYLPNRQPRSRNRDSKMSDGMLRAMDNVLALSMLLKGTTPQLMAAERQKQEEAEEARAKAASCAKVQQWMRSSESPLNVELNNTSMNREKLLTKEDRLPSEEKMR